MSTYPRRPKAEAFSNAVHVVERLHDPTDPSTKRTAPPRSAHVQLGDVPQTLDPAKAEGEFRQHDSVVMVMMSFMYFASGGIFKISVKRVRKKDWPKHFSKAFKFFIVFFLSWFRWKGHGFLNP